MVVSNIFYFQPYLGKWSNLTSIFFKWVETTNQKISKPKNCHIFPSQKHTSPSHGTTCMAMVDEGMLGPSWRPCFPSHLNPHEVILLISLGGEAYGSFSFFWGDSKKNDPWANWLIGKNLLTIQIYTYWKVDIPVTDHQSRISTPKSPLDHAEWTLAMCNASNVSMIFLWLDVFAISFGLGGRMAGLNFFLLCFFLRLGFLK